MSLWVRKYDSTEIYWLYFSSWLSKYHYSRISSDKCGNGCHTHKKSLHVQNDWDTRFWAEDISPLWHLTTINCKIKYYCGKYWSWKPIPTNSLGFESISNRKSKSNWWKVMVSNCISDSFSQIFNLFKIVQNCLKLFKIV